MESFCNQLLAASFQALFSYIYHDVIIGLGHQKINTKSFLFLYFPILFCTLLLFTFCLFPFLPSVLLILTYISVLLLLNIRVHHNNPPQKNFKQSKKATHILKFSTLEKIRALMYKSKVCHQGVPGIQMQGKVTSDFLSETPLANKPILSLSLSTGTTKWGLGCHKYRVSFATDSYLFDTIKQID